MRMLEEESNVYVSVWERERVKFRLIINRNLGKSEKACNK